MTLRNRLIRLAHENPELRADLLPLLKTSSWEPPRVNTMLAKQVAKVVDRHWAVTEVKGLDDIRKAIGLAVTKPMPMRDRVDNQAAVKTWVASLKKPELVSLFRMVEKIKSGTSSEQWRTTEEAVDKWATASTSKTAKSFPRVEREVEADFRRKAITSSERAELLTAIKNAETEQEAQQIVAKHRKSRAASRKTASFGKLMSKSEVEHFLSQNPSWKRRSLVPAFGNKVAPDLTVIAWTENQSGVYHYDVFKGDERLTKGYPLNEEREVKALISRHNQPIYKFHNQPIYKFPGVDPDALLKAASQRKTASESLIDYVVDPSEFGRLYDRLDDVDEQSRDLLYETYQKLQHKFALQGGDREAVSRLRQCAENATRWSPDMLRNNIFKAAHALGIKLPSGMF